MTDDPADTRENQSETESEEWLAKIAESEGLSRDEVVEQLVSSYWTLKEMHGMMEQTKEGRDAGRDVTPLDIEAVYAETLSESLDEIRERLERVEEELPDEDGNPLPGELEMLSQRIAAVEETLGDRHSELESRVDEEFGNLATILDYLIETTDSLTDGLESLSREQEADRRRRVEEERLTELKRLASRLGVRSATCGYCSATVDIAVLPTPECPQCDRRFTDIEPGRRWFGLGSNTLKVTEEPYLEGSSRRAEDRERQDSGSGAITSEASDGDTFVWGEDRD